jgi:hypothetical protein
MKNMVFKRIYIHMHIIDILRVMLEMVHAHANTQNVKFQISCVVKGRSLDVGSSPSLGSDTSSPDWEDSSGSFSATAWVSWKSNDSIGDDGSVPPSFFFIVYSWNVVAMDSEYSVHTKGRIEERLQLMTIVSSSFLFYNNKDVSMMLHGPHWVTCTSHILHNFIEK